MNSLLRAAGNASRVITLHVGLSTFHVKYQAPSVAAVTDVSSGAQDSQRYCTSALSVKFDRQRANHISLWLSAQCTLGLHYALLGTGAFQVSQSSALRKSYIMKDNTRILCRCRREGSTQCHSKEI